MGLIGSLFLGVLAILGAVSVKVLADEFKAWAPTIVLKIVAVAVRTLPTELRERFSEEWSSHLEQVPGDVGKITVACNFLIAANDMANGPLRKRMFDLALGTFAVIFFGPILLLTALVIKLDSPGPVFVRSTCIGQHGKRFGSLQFRTFSVDGSSRGMTSVGKFLRSTTMDELPLLLNVLSGDMSLVGPRPLWDEEDDFGKQVRPIDIYKGWKPGLTGFWLFMEHFEDSTTAWSLKLEAKVILATFAAAIRGTPKNGAYDFESNWKIGLLILSGVLGFAACAAGLQL